MKATNKLLLILMVAFIALMSACEVDSNNELITSPESKVQVVDDAGNIITIDEFTKAITTIGYAHHEVHEGSHYFIEGNTVLGNGGTLYVKLVTPDTASWGHFLWEINSSGILTTTFDEDATGGMAGGARATIHGNNRNINTWTGMHTGANNQATVLTDATQAWVPDELIGNQVFNTDDGSSGIITTNGVITATVAALAGGTDNDWDTTDRYEINGSGFIITTGVTACTGYTQRISDISFGSRSAGGTESRDAELILKQNTIYCRSFLSGTASNIVSFKASWYEHFNK